LKKSEHIEYVDKIQAVFPNFASPTQVIPVNLFLKFLYPVFQYGTSRNIKWNPEWLDTGSLTCFHILWASRSSIVKLLLMPMYGTFRRITVN